MRMEYLVYLYPLERALLDKWDRSSLSSLFTHALCLSSYMRLARYLLKPFVWSILLVQLKAAVKLTEKGFCIGSLYNLKLKHYISKCQPLFCIRLMALCRITVIVKKTNHSCRSVIPTWSLHSLIYGNKGVPSEEDKIYQTNCDNRTFSSCKFSEEAPQ